MHPQIENFLLRPKSHKIALLVGSIAVLGFIMWQYLISPLYEQQAKLEKDIKKVEDELVNERRKAATLPKLREMVRELETKLKVALKELPDKREIPDLIDSVSNLARDSGLEVTLFKPGEQQVKDFYAEVPVEVSVTGTFHQVTTFFDEVSHLDRIVNIKKIHIHDAQIGEAQVTVKVDCQVTTFRYLDEAERAKAAADKSTEAAQSRRRGR